MQIKFRYAVRHDLIENASLVSNLFKAASVKIMNSFSFFKKLSSVFKIGV